VREITAKITRYRSLTRAVQRKEVTRKGGFLPIEANIFDRIFIGIALFIAIHLLWMRFVETYVPLGVATALSLVLTIVIVKWG